MSLASWSGHLTLAKQFEWLGSTPALVALGAACVVESIGYLIPWVDHALDALALPMAAVAGVVMTYAMASDLGPFLHWSLAIVAGGGSALSTRGVMAATRGASTATTGGTANPLIGIFEAVTSLVMSVLALVAPILAILLLALGVFVAVRILRRIRRRLRCPRPEMA